MRVGIAMRSRFIIYFSFVSFYLQNSRTTSRQMGAARTDGRSGTSALLHSGLFLKQRSLKGQPLSSAPVMDAHTLFLHWSRPSFLLFLGSGMALPQEGFWYRDGPDAQTAHCSPPSLPVPQIHHRNTPAYIITAPNPCPIKYRSGLTPFEGF